MSIYVGDKKFDLHYTTTGNKVNRSVFKGENKIWPLYEFSFYDGSMQKNIENVPASGQNKSIEIRTCEDSWWHKLKFDEIYVFDKELSSSWLRYDAINLNCQENPIKTHWLSVTKGDNYSINTENSDDRQTISFSDNYNNISNLNNSGGTCNENLHDINMNYKIDKNDWFVSRSGYMYGKQYDEWDHISGTTKNYYHFYDLSPSDNTPIIYIYQVANSWYNSDENKEFEQKIEFTCTPIETSVVGGEVQLTWKIYSLSSSGTTIYYGSNIASNNSTEETFGEVYAKGYMWITASNPNITLNTDSVKKSISSDGVVTWTMTAKWGSNEALGKNASHTIAFNGFPESIPFNIDSTYNISATCTQISKDRENIFTLNISSKNNWRPGSATCKCSQKGETRQIQCYVNDTNSFNDKKTSITINVNKVEPGKKAYYLSVDKSSITTQNNNFTVKSYYIQDSNSGVTITVYAQCEDGDIVTSRSITQEPNLGGTGGLGFTVACNDGQETITPNNVKTDELNADFTKTITAEAHSILGDTINNVITVTQNESGKIITLVHIADPAVEHKYEYRILLFDNKSNVQDITNKNGISNITLSSNINETTIYARLEEKCTSVTDTGVCEIDNNDTMNIYKSYDYIPIKSTVVSHSGVKLSDFTDFTFSGDENWSISNKSWGDKYITITLSGSVNDSSSSIKYCSMNMLSDTTSTILPNVCDKDTDAFWFKFSLNEITSTGGYTRTGTFLANYNDVAKAICNLSQTSSVTSSSTSTSITGKSKDISLSFDPSDAFGKKDDISESNGEYTVYVKTLTDFYANSDPGFVEGLDNGYEINVAEGITQDVTVDNYTESVKFKVVVKGYKYYTQYEDENKNKTNSRSVTVTASYEYNNKETSITTSTKTQNVCNKVDNTQKYEVSNPSITWTASEQNTSLYTDYNPKSGVETTVSINSKISGSTSEDKTIKFTATINDTDVSKDFTITWPKTAIISTSWTYTINIDISLTNKCQSSNFYITIDDTKIDDTEVTVNSGSSNTISYTSEEITATEVKPTIKLYKNGTEIEDYGENKFTITANTLYKSYSENCEDTTQYSIKVIGGPDFTTCPGTTVEIQFKITDGTNYYNFNGNGTPVINNDKFAINEYISYKDTINTIKVTTSDTDGDTGKLTISVNVNGSDDTVTKDINITNSITYTCGGIEEV